MRVTWDIFCRVVDNFGDIGVSWRLARQLSQEHGFVVRLWVDNLQAFQRICPAVVTQTDWQTIDGVQIAYWHDDFAMSTDLLCADVVIEAFACQLPEHYIALMRSKQKVLWLNLEYLTAEPWAAECHTLPSLQAGGLQKYFFFPGFTEQTGGLLREATLLSQRDALVTTEKRAEFLARMGVQVQATERLISLFTYANASVQSWLEALSTDTRVNHLLVLQGPSLVLLADYFRLPDLQVGQIYQCGNVKVQVLPYIQQEDFDRLLWSCDFNCVRGEDSFVRAQWAAKPFIWHIYPQHDEAHLDKLSAFISLYNNDLDDYIKTNIEDSWHAWNTSGDMRRVWQELIKHEEILKKHAVDWCEQQRKLADLATKLACFYQDWL
ncbi:MAG: elongation factor P maturation arginine rhamnosyltransferase EarP [Pseudomonas sp.]|nr:elongation factor P maturation arginine rhamnosyltransferase EarP [Pseudomonas sp.]